MAADLTTPDGSDPLLAPFAGPRVGAAAVPAPGAPLTHGDVVDTGVGRKRRRDLPAGSDVWYVGTPHLAGDFRAPESRGVPGDLGSWMGVPCIDSPLLAHAQASVPPTPAAGGRSPRAARSTRATDRATDRPTDRGRVVAVRVRLRSPAHVADDAALLAAAVQAGDPAGDPAGMTLDVVAAWPVERLRRLGEAFADHLRALGHDGVVIGYASRHTTGRARVVVLDPAGLEVLGDLAVLTLRAA